MILHDSNDDSTPVDLDLDLVLEKMPPKTFIDTKTCDVLNELTFPSDITVRDAIDRVIRLVSVGSKRFLTNKVDRSRCYCSNTFYIQSSDFRCSDRCRRTTIIYDKGLVNAGATEHLSGGESLTNPVWGIVISSWIT